MQVYLSQPEAKPEILEWGLAGVWGVALLKMEVWGIAAVTVQKFNVEINQCILKRFRQTEDNT